MHYIILSVDKQILQMTMNAHWERIPVMRMLFA